MTNAAKYLKDGVDIKQMATEMVDYFNFPPYEGIGESSIEEFFGKEVQPTLTEDERVILRNIAKHSDFEKIGRDKIGGLYVTCRINIPTEEKWTISFFDHLFQFIKERRRILY